MYHIEKHSVNNHSVWRGRLFKANGENIKNPIPFYMRPLNINDASAMSSLSERIYSQLTKEEECFIHKHTLAEYQKSLTNPDMKYIGIFVGAQLIGMSYLHICRDSETLSAEIPDLPQVIRTECQNINTGALCSDCVLPEYRGNGLNQLMISYRKDLAWQLGCNHVFSIIDRKNHWNMVPYFGSGFQMIGTTIDPDDGGNISLMHYNFNRKQRIIETEIRASYLDFSKIDTLLANHYIGSGFNTQTGEIIFTPNIQAQQIISHCNQHLENQYISHLIQSHSGGLVYV